jgi:hypothetical protein
VSVARRKLLKGPKGGKSLGPMLPTEVVIRYGVWLENTDRRIAHSDWQRAVLKYCVFKQNLICFLSKLLGHFKKTHILCRYVIRLFERATKY